MSDVVEVQVQLYIEGKGPVHQFRAPLKGFGRNRLDLEHIMREHKLKAIYAFSLASGRGNRLFYDPRNGLSRIAYSGTPDATIILDGEPSGPFLLMLAKVLFGLLLIGGLACLTLADSLPDWLPVFKDSGRTYFVVLTCFTTILYTQLVWQPMRKFRYSNPLARPQQNLVSVEDQPPESKKDV